MSGLIDIYVRDKQSGRIHRVGDDQHDQLVMCPKCAYPSWFPLFGREGELHRPFICITFVDNKQMLEYRDASLRCFDELMKLKKEAGDFVDPEPEEKG